MHLEYYFALHSENELYGDRATSENRIEHIKNQMPGDKILTDDFCANEALWLMSVLSYNIMIWMRKLTDEKKWREEPNTFRNWFISVPSKIVKSGRQIIAKMDKNYYCLFTFEALQFALFIDAEAIY